MLDDIIVKCIYRNLIQLRTTIKIYAFLLNYYKSVRCKKMWKMIRCQWSLITLNHNAPMKIPKKLNLDITGSGKIMIKIKKNSHKSHNPS